MTYYLRLGTKQLALNRVLFVVGRGSHADLQLDGSGISRRHAAFRIHQHKVFVEDLGSRNGTLVNGRRAAGRIELAAGDVIAIGSHHLRLGSDGHDATSPELATLSNDPREKATLHDDETANVLLARLSQRELEVLVLIARGLTRRAIAEQLGISLKTVETYRTRLRDKLGADSRAELVQLALEADLLSASD